MLVGIDFDNTIAGYDDVFAAAAVREGLLQDGTARTKLQVREALRRRPGGEEDWMRLQGRVYGAHMGEARLFDGVCRFLTKCKNELVDVCVVSHKTQFGHFDKDKIDLRQAALQWMESHGFFSDPSFSFDRTKVFFETTRDEKIARIRNVGCTHFIDDLEEIFVHPDFPTNTRRFLFAPAAESSGDTYRSWPEITAAIFDPPTDAAN